jgi:hypothetical protein
MKYLKYFESKSLVKKLTPRDYDDLYFSSGKITEAVRSDANRIDRLFSSLDGLIINPRVGLIGPFVDIPAFIKISAGHETWYINTMKDDYFIFTKAKNIQQSDNYLIDGWDGLEIYLKELVGR